MQATRPPQLRLLSRLLDLQAPTHPVQQPLPFRRFHTPRSHLTPSRRPPSLQTPHPRPRLPSSRTLRAFRSRFNSTQPSPETTSSPSLSARLKKLSREYGWSALGIYLLLSALDFPFCFLAVRLLGTERIGRWEHAVVEGVKSLVLQIPGAEALWRERFGVGHAQGADGGVVEEEPRRLLEQEVEAVEERWDHGVEEAEKANQGETASPFSPIPMLLTSFPSSAANTNIAQHQASGRNSPSPTPSTNPSSSSASR